MKKLPIRSSQRNEIAGVRSNGTHRRSIARGRLRGAIPGDVRQMTPSWHDLHGRRHGADESVYGEEPVPLASSGLDQVEDAACECCGMSEECTTGYISAVRRRFSGRWVCGLCAEAVAEEAGKRGAGTEAALAAHMGVCRRFNGFGRTHPALFQADAMRGILRKLSGLGSPKSNTNNPMAATERVKQLAAGGSPAA